MAIFTRLIFPESRIGGFATVVWRVKGIAIRRGVIGDCNFGTWSGQEVEIRQIRMERRGDVNWAERYQGQRQRWAMIWLSL